MQYVLWCANIQCNCTVAMHLGSLDGHVAKEYSTKEYSKKLDQVRAHKNRERNSPNCMDSYHKSYPARLNRI